jgi:DNA-binding CsgD family transcriptional regulator
MIPAGDARWHKVVEVMPLTPEWVVDHRADAAAAVGVRAMRRADHVLERTGDIAHRAAVKFSLGSLLTWGLCELDAGRDLLEAARRLFGEAGDEHAVLLATNELGYHLGMADDGQSHERLAREVLLAAEASGDQFLRLQAICSLVWAVSLAGRLDETLSLIETGIEVAAQSDKIYRRTYLLGVKAFVQHHLGDPRAREVLELARDLNPAYRDTLILDNTAQIAWESGDLQGAVAAFVDQMAWDGGVSTRRAFGAGMAVISLAEMGRHEEAAELQANLDAAFGGRVCWVLSRLADWSRAMASSLSAGRAAALDALGKVTEDATASGYWCWSRWMIADLADSAVYAHHDGWAARAQDLLLADPCPPQGPSHGGLRALVAGAAAIARGQPGQAGDVLEEAVSQFRVAGWRLFEGRALALLGTSLARSDRARAVEALEQAVARFAECQAVVRRQETLTVLAGLGSRGRRKKADLIGPGSLSAREREVARLAAEGCSAREIAERLFIGERTVETHLANAYAKLGVASKLDLVRRAGELGI